MSDLLRSNVIVATGTLLSRLTGLGRVAVLAAVLGGTAVSDAYLLANETPNIVYELLVGGVLSATLIPLFTSFDEKHDDEARNAVITTALAIISATTVVAVLAAPWIFGAFSQRVGSNVDPDVFRSVGTTLTRIFLVQILFYGLTSLANAFLNSRRRFFAAAWSPILPNLVIIATLLSLPAPSEGTFTLQDVLDSPRIRLTLGLGATVGIASMALVLLPATRRAGLQFRFVWDPRHPAVRRLLSLSFWTLGFVAANVVALTVVRNLTEPGSSGATAYTLAFFIFILPHGLLGVSIATTFQPELAIAVARRSQAGLIRSASLGIRMTGLLTIPAGVGLFVLRRPIVGAAFEYGNFSADAALETSRALGGLALGLGAFSIYLFTLRTFYAHQDTKTAFKVNVVENGLNIALAFALVGSYGVLGLGASYALAYAISALWVLQILSYKVPGFQLREVLISIGRICFACVLMAEAVWIAARLVGTNTGSGAVVRVVVGAVVGVIVYGAVMTALHAPEIDALRRRLPSRWPGALD